MPDYVYIIRYKEYGKDWRSTSYSSSQPVSREYLIDFFGLNECEEYIIVENI